MKTDTRITHTPGPWKTAIDRNGRIYVLMDDDVAAEVCEVCTENLDDVRQGDADARLIAAAPQLLAALRAFLAAEALIDDEYYTAVADAEHTARALLARIDDAT